MKNRIYWFKPFVFGVLVTLSGCFSSGDLSPRSGNGNEHINNKTKFSSRAYGVAASPRVTTSRRVRKGGGRSQLGKPYKIRGKWYVPKEEPGYDRVGNASWYGPNFHGRLTANGEVYDQYALSGAHPTFPLPSYARVTNTSNGQSVIIRVNDRGPYHSGRIIDLSARAAHLLDYQRKGVAQVRVEYIGRAPLHGRDAKYLAASHRQTNDLSDRALAFSNSKGPETDNFPVGSIRPNTSKAATDPFLQELNAITKNIDTGSTLAKRLVLN